MLDFLYFQERMIMGALGFTLLTNIKIWANNTFISNSNDWISSTFITGYMGMNNLGIDLRLFFLHFRFWIFNFTFCHNFFLNFWNNFRHNFTEFLINRLIKALFRNNCLLLLWWFCNFFWNFFWNQNTFNDGNLFSFLHGFIFNNNLLSMIIKIFVTLLYFNSNLVEPWFKKSLHIDVVEEANHVIIAVLVCKCVFGW